MSFLVFAFAFQASRVVMTEPFISRRTELKIPLVPFVSKLVVDRAMTELFRQGPEVQCFKSDLSQPSRSFLLDVLNCPFTGFDFAVRVSTKRPTNGHHLQHHNDTALTQSLLFYRKASTGPL